MVISISNARMLTMLLALSAEANSVGVISTTCETATKLTAPPIHPAAKVPATLAPASPRFIR